MAEVIMELAPLPIPSTFAIKHKPGRRQDGFQVAHLKITDLSEETINSLCDELRRNMLEAAGLVRARDAEGSYVQSWLDDELLR